MGETSAIQIVGFQQSNMTPILYKVKLKCHNCLKKIFVVQKIPLAGSVSMRNPSSCKEKCWLIV